MSIFKRFIAYYAPYKGLFYADLCCAVIVSLVDLAFPQLLKLFTKDAFIHSPEEYMNVIAFIGVGMVVMYLIRFGCQYFITSWGHVMGAYMERDMRQDLFDHYQRLSFAYYDKNNTGEMMSKLVSDLFDISELAHHGPENLLISSLKILGSFIILIMINIPMTLILLFITMLMVIFSIYQNKKMQAVFMDNRKKIAGVNSQVQDTLAGIRVVKSFANEEL